RCCDRCAKLKRSCDGLVVCSRCKGFGIAVCTYSQSRRTRRQ
ncbi:unnamed protein product, partial [Phaeothamnion confervicola]